MWFCFFWDLWTTFRVWSWHYQWGGLLKRLLEQPSTKHYLKYIIHRPIVISVSETNPHFFIQEVKRTSQAYIKKIYSRSWRWTSEYWCYFPWKGRLALLPSQFVRRITTRLCSLFIVLSARRLRKFYEQWWVRKGSSKKQHNPLRTLRLTLFPARTNHLFIY